MLAIDETAKDNSKIAQLKLVIDNYFKGKYNAEFIFEKININCRILATDYLQLHHAKWIGCTVLHCAFQNKDLETVDVLLNHGADFTIKNAGGSTALHQYVEEEPRLILEACKSEDSFINAVILAHTKHSNFKNPVNPNGLSHFHIACAVNSVEVVREFLQNGVSFDHTVNRASPFFPGFSPLHFAAQNCASEVAEVLLSHGVNVHNKDAKEMTPVHMILQRRLKVLGDVSSNVELSTKSEKILQLFLKKGSNDGMVVIDDWGLSNLHIACTLDDMKIAESYLQNVIDINHAVNVDSPLWPGYTPLHFAAHCNIDTVNLLMKKGADISVKDTKGVTPFDICIERYKAEDIYAILSLHPIWKNIMLSDGKTKLTDLVFAMRDPYEFDLFLRKLSKNSNIYNSPVWPSGCTPMHLAVILSKENASASEDDEEVNMKLLRILHKHNFAVLSSKDAHGYTPLHIAFRLKKQSALDLLFELLTPYPNLTNHVDEDGLSYVHIASANNDIFILEKLLSTSTNINAVYKGKPLLSPMLHSGSTPLHFAVAYGSEEAVEILMMEGADLYAKDANHMTPIHLLLMNPEAGDLLTSPNLRDSVVSGIGLSHLHVVCRWDKPEIVKRLLDVGANIDGIITYKPMANASLSKFPYLDKYDGYSPLLMAYEEDSDETVQFLLKRGADVFVVDTKGKALLHTAIERSSDYYYDMFIDVLMERVDLQSRLRADTGMTALHVACLDLNNFKDIEKLISDGENVNAQVRADSPILKGFTPLHLVLHVSQKYLDDAVHKVIELFCKVGADVTLPNGNSETAVQMAWEFFDVGASEARYKRVNTLLEAQRDFSLNPANVYGLSHFHVACTVCNTSVVQRFLRHADVDVERRLDFFYDNSPGYSALQLAVGSPAQFCGMLMQLRTVDLLLKNGANIHAEDKYGDTPLHECARFNSVDLFERLVRGGADVNAKNTCGDTPLYYYLKSDNASVEGLKFLLRFECHLNVFNAITGVGYVGEAAGKLPYADLQNLVHAISVNFNQEMEADNLGRTIIHNIVSISSPNISASEYATLIHEISGTVCDIDSQDHLGQTALHVAAKICNYKGVSGLLMAGVDVNITDASGKTALVCDLDIHSQYGLRDESTYESEGEDDKSEKTCNLMQINKTLAIHIKKLQFCGLDVIKNNDDLACKVFEKLDNKIEWSEVFLEEVETTKNTTIGSHSLTLYDFLSETGAVADYPTMSEMKREDVVEFFSLGKADFIRKTFPEIAGIFQLQYRKAVARPRLVESAKNAMESMIGFRMPEVCSRIILVLLSNLDLKNLIASTI